MFCFGIEPSSKRASYSYLMAWWCSCCRYCCSSPATADDVDHDADDADDDDACTHSCISFDLVFVSLCFHMLWLLYAALMLRQSESETDQCCNSKAWSWSRSTYSKIVFPFHFHTNNWQCSNSSIITSSASSSFSSSSSSSSWTLVSTDQ